MHVAVCAADCGDWTDSCTLCVLLCCVSSAAFHAAETSDPSARHQLPLSTLQAALRVEGSSLSLDELECILANLIFDGKIKGYIAHRRCVVLSKQEPFPKVA